MKKSVSVLYMFAGILFASCLLISNILATKILMIGPWAAPAGVLIFPIAYILNDVITEVWGFAKARLIIWTGFAVNILAVLFFTVGIVVPGAPFWQNQEAFATILGNTPRIVVASLSAYLIGSFLNAFILILPITVWVVGFVKRVEGVDTFDTNLSYNLFRVKEI
jgi:uncharacterized integral membrane protein (TIGR00697 family)